MPCAPVNAQFYWQNYEDKNYLKALETLRELQDEGCISALGLCNFDSIRTDEICTELGHGVISTNQVQVRYETIIFLLNPCLTLCVLVFHPRHPTLAWDESRLRKTRLEASDIWHLSTFVLTFSEWFCVNLTSALCVQCGGLLSDQWLDQKEPDLYSSNLTPSQRKVIGASFPVTRHAERDVSSYYSTWI